MYIVRYVNFGKAYSITTVHYNILYMVHNFRVTSYKQTDSLYLNETWDSRFSLNLVAVTE